uniref:Transferrin-like domain-containing protein n=1 Tax=Gongylonema pulchrum TaxID=637853 RepID=A0A183CV76_9BILA
LEADVWIVNKTALQLTNFRINNAKDGPGYSLYFSKLEEVTKAANVYKIISSSAAEFSKPIENIFGEGKLGDHIVVTVPDGYSNWKHFGVAAIKNWVTCLYKL